MMIDSLPQEAWEVLDREIHLPLVMDLEGVAREANIPAYWIWTSMREYCTDREVEYVRTLRQRASQGQYGLVYTGAHPSRPMTNRMMAVTGACLRNFIGARVMTLDEVLQSIKLGQMPQPSVLLVPNFFVGTKEGGKIADWQISGLLSLLYARQAEERQTLLYVRSMVELGEAYGPPFVQHLKANFELLEE